MVPLYYSGILSDEMFIHSGQILWVQNYGFPVVAVYSWQPEGLQKVEMTSVASQTLTHLLQQTDGRAAYWESIFQKEGFTPKQNTLMWVLL